MKPKTFAIMMCVPAFSLLTGCGMPQQFVNPFGSHQPHDGTEAPAAVLHSRDDVQYFPSGETPNMKRALEQYTLEQQQGDTTPE